ncbi:MAG: sulfotransferase [Candidatus Kuenenia sp.]|nr:sulfotransferase [Candidatus Kuenenia hertensis]
MSEKLGIDINKNPYFLNLGNIRTRVNTDVNNNSTFYTFKRKLKSAFRYSELSFGAPFLSSLITDVHKGIKNNFLLYEAVISVLGADAIVDSSKDYLKAVDLYKNAPEKVRIILLIRDGRAVFFSGLKRNFSYKKSLNSWKNLYTRALPLIRKHVAPEHVLQIRYEDLVNDIHYELAKICEFVGFHFEKEMIDFTRKTHHITAGNDIRFCKSSAIRKPDMLWKEKMTKEDLKYFEKKAGTLNQAFGYH